MIYKMFLYITECKGSTKDTDNDDSPILSYYMCQIQEVIVALYVVFVCFGNLFGVNNGQK